MYFAWQDYDSFFNAVECDKLFKYLRLNITKDITENTKKDVIVVSLMYSIPLIHAVIITIMALHTLDEMITMIIFI